MINNIPSPQEFKNHGIDYLNLAWDGVMSLLVKIYEAWDEDVAVDFWTAAQRRIATNILLAHQGTEFLLKSKISEISPFLLISREPSQWPKNCTERDVDFSEFRTVDAQDLIKISNTVSTKLSHEFIKQYDLARTLRNSIAHTIKKDLKLTAKEVLVYVLESANEFVIGSNWFELRREWAGREIESVLAYDSDYSSVLAKEAAIAISELNSSQIERYFGLSKKRRRYNCPNCVYSYKWGVLENAKTAVLEPNTPISQKIYCFVCGKTTEVIRKDCGFDRCKSNVIWQHKDLCLTCMNGEAD
ncbi:MAG: hypothetical protein HY911_10150 [Desulfobacterales bacterium]|nr:hypothetical protein [Desulfobacterales bacterium]